MLLTKRATIRDVAELAEVSVGTVSRVLAGNATVKHGIHSRVRGAIEALNYRPTPAARALRSNRVNVVGLLVPDILNPYFAQLANELEKIAADKEFALILSSSHNDPGRELRQFAAILEHKPAAVIFVPTAGAPKFSVPPTTFALSVDRRAEGFQSITLDQKQSAALALNHLVELGHRRIAYFAGPPSITNAQERLEGVVGRVDQLKSGGQDIDIEISAGEFDYDSGEKMARAVLERPEASRPTGIVAASDQQAIGAIRAARDLGLTVPYDLSVVGFDDITLASLVVPRLTTVQQPVREMAEAAFETVLAVDAEKLQAEFMGRLVVRDSTAAPKNFAAG
jgi:LacI family transcriptional regulator